MLSSRVIYYFSNIPPQSYDPLNNAQSHVEIDGNLGSRVLEREMLIYNTLLEILAVVLPEL